MEYPEWTVIGPFTYDCSHLWLTNNYLSQVDQWQIVTGEIGTFEFRQCVECGAKQIRELPS
jgi:hypothetical protein